MVDPSTGRVTEGKMMPSSIWPRRPSSGVPQAGRMRRRPGIAGIQQRRDTSVQMRNVGEVAERARADAMKEQLAVFKASLEAFALKYKDDIRRDPIFRAQFHKMCANCGVDPLASNKGFWAELLGFGDFYYELGVQIVEACLASRARDGGLCELAPLMQAVLRRRGSAATPVSEDDVLRAIERLRSLGGGWSVHHIGGCRFVRSVPVALNGDTSEVIRLAAAGGAGGALPPGCVSREGLQTAAGWRRERAEAALMELVKCGMAMIDDGGPTGERLFWLPCVSMAGAAATAGER